MNPIFRGRYEEEGRSETQRANRRRLMVFMGVFFAMCAVGLAYDFLRPPEYRATSRLQITPASYIAHIEVPGAPIASAPADPDRPFLTEVQKLSSRPLLAEVANRMTKAGIDLSALGPDPVAALRSKLTVAPVPGTHVVELAATGPHPELPAALLVGISEAYRTELAHSYDEHSGEATARADDEVHRLESAVAAKRRAVEGFRVQNNIVSSQREENEALGQLQGLGKSLQAARDRVNAAEGNLSALRKATAAGKGVVLAKDNPTLANLELRASQAREDLWLWTPTHARFAHDWPSWSGRSRRSAPRANRLPSRRQKRSLPALAKPRGGFASRSLRDGRAPGNSPPGSSNTPSCKASSAKSKAATGTRCSAEPSSRPPNVPESRRYRSLSRRRSPLRRGDPSTGAMRRLWLPARFSLRFSRWRSSSFSTDRSHGPRSSWRNP